MTLADIREAARAALVRESQFRDADRLMTGLDSGALDMRCAAVRAAIDAAIEHRCERETLTALCRLYIAEQEADA
jgi:hypothetical protein